MLRGVPSSNCDHVGEEEMKAEKKRLFSCWIYCNMKGFTAVNLLEWRQKKTNEVVNNSHTGHLFVMINSLPVFLVFVIRLQSRDGAQN